MKIVNHTLLKLSIAAAVLFVSGGAAYEQESAAKRALRDCLEDADDYYYKAWADACSRKPGGLNINGSNCLLPGRIADSLSRDLDSGRNLCFQESAAGLLSVEKKPVEQKPVERKPLEQAQQVVVPLNKSVTLEVPRPFATAVITSPDIADAKPLTDRTLWIQAKRIGTTEVSLFDENRGLVKVIDVGVQLDASQRPWAQQVVVPLNKSVTLEVPRPYAVAAIGSPDIADAEPLTDRTLSIQAKRIGTTDVSLFDENWRLVKVIDVDVQ